MASALAAALARSPENRHARPPRWRKRRRRKSLIDRINNIGIMPMARHPAPYHGGTRRIYKEANDGDMASKMRRRHHEDICASKPPAWRRRAARHATGGWRRFQDDLAIAMRLRSPLDGGAIQSCILTSCASDDCNRYLAGDFFSGAPSVEIIAKRD